MAHAVATLDPILLDLARAAEDEDPREYRRLAETANVTYGASWNFFVKTLLPGAIQARASSDELRARFRLVRAALSLEQHKAVEGRYPKVLPHEPGLEDPFAWPSPMRYRISPSGADYTLWSVGLNENDDGGVAPMDLVLQR